MINHKIYIGQTVHRVKKRFDEHKRAKSVIGNAIREFGVENFVFVVIEKRINIFEICKNWQATDKNKKNFS